MEQVIKLVRTYRLATGLAEQLRLAEEIFSVIEPPLRQFVFASVPEAAAEDVVQEVLAAAVTALAAFKGDSEKQFWGWCYRIARNKIYDHRRKQAVEKKMIQQMPPEELWQLVDASAQTSPISSQDRLDLEDAMKLLISSKPECYDYLWKHFVFGLDYAEIAEEKGASYDGVRMKIGRCLDEAKALIA